MFTKHVMIRHTPCSPRWSLAIRAVVVGAMLTGPAAQARADVIADWYEKAITAGYEAGLATPLHIRHMAIVTRAMFDAVNTITPRYGPYRPQSPASAGASPDAAAVAAAHYLLVRMYANQASELDAAYRASLHALPEGPNKAAGIELGERTAAALLAERANDGSAAPNTYRPFTGAGKYVPTVFPVAPNWGSLTPFALEAGNQFRPGAPYALTSTEWANDFNEVKKMGAKSNAGRTVEQTDVARFWELTGPGTYGPAVQQLVESKKLDIVDRARVFALVEAAAADSMIAVLDAKYAYGFWRPVTAIRNGDLDGSDATERDPAWEPLIPTPMHPEYPCAHCISQSAVASVLEALWGSSITPFTLTSPTAPGVTRRFTRLSDYVDEVVNARVWDGVHYRTSGEVGASMGRQIGAYVVEHSLKPSRR